VDLFEKRVIVPVSNRPAILSACDEAGALMQKRKIKLLDTIASVKDIPSRKLKRGEVGIIVEILAPEVFEVEFCDEDGQTYAELALRADQIIPLHNRGDALRIVA